MSLKGINLLVGGTRANLAVVDDIPYVLARGGIVAFPVGGPPVSGTRVDAGGVDRDSRRHGGEADQDGDGETHCEPEESVSGARGEG